MQPEYYPTRAERALLDQYGEQIIQRSGATTLVELGSGSSEKTPALLDPLTATAGGAAVYVPVDVSVSALIAAVGKLEQEYPDLTIHGLKADIDQHLDLIPNYGTRLVGFLGGTIGNYRPAERHTFLSELAKNSNSGDTVLIGVDLIKDPQRPIRAYDDAASPPSSISMCCGFSTGDLELTSRYPGFRTLRRGMTKSTGSRCDCRLKKDTWWT